MYQNDFKRYECMFGGENMWQKIEILIKERGLTQYSLAKKMNVTTSVITDLKKGRIKKPSFELMVKIADALDISLDFFREGSEENC